MTTELLNSCRDFNRMYKLPVPNKPSLENLGEDWRERLRNFKKTLAEELNEIDEIIESEEENPLVILTAIADLLGDINVYTHSESLKFGIPLDGVLKVIMDSNMSKLGEDGNPIYNEDGKVMKGPNYWKPEPKIMELLFRKALPLAYVPDEAEESKYLTNQESAA